MKLFKNSIALILYSLTLFSISNVNSIGYSSNVEQKLEIECLSDKKKCIEPINKELLYKVEV